MNKQIQPDYHKDIIATCACGAQYPTGSTREEIKVEVCSACHPFFTGKQKLMDTAGRVDKFRARLEAANKMKESAAKKALEKAAKPVKADKEEKTSDK
jgi:large subunit ribosomal protein L31